MTEVVRFERTEETRKNDIINRGESMRKGMERLKMIICSELVGLVALFSGENGEKEAAQVRIIL